MYYVMKPGIQCYSIVAQKNTFSEAADIRNKLVEAAIDVIILKDAYEENRWGAPVNAENLETDHNYPAMPESEIHGD